ncbi:anti-sigma factor [Hymenobacter sp. BT186]|uniref:Regulator of SigK n=1 Tax=Hymenobacter telluris TaxID=2816474 RepID=A0A939EW45_9BACT|nr:anti-sigma factor [Hymenobacter telluris]MBO0358904.1 anti-sigma factor [Hymenobacter telluris]MBW3374930.1 anti-sigma factor [Hymenobacter norwichensis]
MDTQQYIESGVLEEYALGILPEAERAEVERLASIHPDIRHELDAIIMGLDAYAEAHSLTPPPAMRDRVLNGWQQAIRNQGSKENAIPVVPMAAAPTVGPATAATPPATPTATEPIVRSINSAPEPIREAPARSYGWLMAASVALLLSLGGNYVLYNRWQNTQSELFAVQREQAQFATVQQASQKQLETQRGELAVLRDEQFRHVTLAGTPAAPSAKARVLYNPATRAVYVDVRSLPAPPAGKQYQLWALDNGKPVDAGVLAASTAAGEGLQQMKDIASAQAFAMTVEDAGGSPTPTLSTMTVVGNI